MSASYSEIQGLGLERNLEWDREFPSIDLFDEALERSYNGRVELESSYRGWNDQEQDYSPDSGWNIDPMVQNDIDQKMIYSLPSV